MPIVQLFILFALPFNYRLLMYNLCGLLTGDLVQSLAFSLVVCDCARPLSVSQEEEFIGGEI